MGGASFLALRRRFRRDCCLRRGQLCTKKLANFFVQSCPRRKQQSLLKRLRKAKKEAPPMEKPEVVKTHLRDMVILPEMVGSMVGVYNGKTFNQVEIKPEMCGHYLGGVLHHLQASQARSSRYRSDTFFPFHPTEVEWLWSLYK
uniref:40S ribosomal protein S15 n=1 Tax=Salmo salar TaxID=8030 RepID=C0H784_SALSA|nr:40S ribosomal protein S15 [Salmo salar]ACN12250.1 40S ribosomal protein S15 [Salmo salar]